MKSQSKSTRRDFLKKTAFAAATFSIVPRHVLGGAGHVPPSEKINLAIVGAGGQGRSNMRGLLHQPDVQIIAVADPAEQWDLDPFYYKGAGGRLPVKAEVEKHYSAKTPNFRCADYEDFRQMLEKEKAVDAILCATPDHLHAFVSVTAMRLGKHVYCEKPLAHNIWEARTIAKVAKETGVATQMGNQGHSSNGIRETCEFIWAGAIGNVREVHSWVSATRWNKGLTTAPTEAVAAPAGLNWDLWLGPRESRPFHPAYAPVTWRDFWAFGSGGLGDFGCHDLDAACWALDLHEPETVESVPAGNMDAEIVPHGEMCYFQFGARGGKPPVKVTWYDGGLRPPRPKELAEDESLPSRGALFVGDKGILLCSGTDRRPSLLPEWRMDIYQRPAPTIQRSKGHHREWLDAIKGGPQAGSSFDYGARLTEIVLLGVLSLRTGRKIYWDAAAMEAKGVKGSDQLIKEPYRPAWRIS